MRARPLISIIALAGLTLQTACAPLPDLSGYSAATTSVRQSVASAGTAVSSEADRAADVLVGPTNAATLQAGKAEFDAAWVKNLKAMDAMVRYASSIEAIAAAGNEGGKSAQKVADQLQGLIGLVGIPIAPAVGVAIATGEKLHEQLARVRAAKSLKQSLAAADPAIRELQAILTANVADAERAFVRLTKLELASLDFAATGSYGDFIALDATLSARSAQLSTDLKNALESGDNARAATFRAELKTIADARATIAPQLADYRTRRAAIDARRRAGGELLGASRDALIAWTEAHAELVTALNNRRPVTLDSLNAAVVDIRDLIKQWRAL